MRTTIQNTAVKLFVLFVCICSGYDSLAQDAGAVSQTTSNVSHTSTSTTSAMWYSNPIVWVAGGILLLLLIIVIASSGKNKNADTHVSRTTRITTTTIEKD